MAFYAIPISAPKHLLDILILVGLITLANNFLFAYIPVLSLFVGMLILAISIWIFATIKDKAIKKGALIGGIVALAIQVLIVRGVINQPLSFYYCVLSL